MRPRSFVSSRMGKTRRVTAAAIALAAAATTLAACSGKSSSTGGSGGKVNLEFWTNLTVKAQSSEVQSQVKACLQQPQLKGVTANFDIVPLSAMQTRLQTLSKSGNLPNVMQVTSNAVALAQSLNAIVPVNDVLSKLGGAQNFEDSSIEPVTRAGQTYAIPDYVTHQAIYYRKDLFAAAGITATPTSWSELIADATKLNDKSKGIYGFGVPLGSGNATAQYTLFQALYAEGVFVFDPKTGGYAFDQDNLQPVVNAINFLMQLYRAASPPASAGWGLTDQRTAFANGEVAMTSEWGAVIGQAATQNPKILSDIGMFPMPGPGSSTAPVATFGDSYNFTVGNGSAAQEKASKALVECLSTPQSSAKRALTRPIFAEPAIKGGRTVSTYTENKYVQQFSDILKATENAPFTTWYRYGLEHEMTPMASQIEYLTFIPDNLEQVAAGKETAQQAAENINGQLKKSATELKLLGGSGASAPAGASGSASN